MKKLKAIIAKNFESFTFYYRHLRYRVFLAVSLSFAVGVLDGFGLSMFLPLLQMASGSEEVSSDSMGNLSFLVEWLEFIGINLNIMSVLIVMMTFFTMKGLATFLNTAYRAILRQFFIKKLRQEMLSAFNQLRYKHFVKADVGRIQNTMGGEIERVSRSFRDYFRTAERAILVMVYMGFAFFVDAQFAILVAIGLWFTNFLYKIIYNRTKGVSKKFTDDSHRYQGQIIQHVANYKYLKSTALLKKYGDQLRESIENIEKSRRHMGILDAILLSAREPLLIIIVAAVILIQTKVLNAPLGPILISLLFFYRALTALVTMQSTWNRFLEVSGSLNNVIDLKEEIKKNKENPGKEAFTILNNQLEIKNCYFSFNQEPVLKNICLEINKNETVALVGESGSGKTTLVNILAGLFPPDKGIFNIDGKDSQLLNISNYQRRLGYITQDPAIFNDTIFNNVTFWANPTPDSLKRFEEALRQAAIYDYVQELPQKEKTLLGNNGVNLSGGQKQRLSIARELYKDIDILIMDEATSSLDTETELLIQKSIDTLKGKLTILIVAHRMSTIRNADRVVVLDRGQIEHSGSYKELIEESVTFKRMVALQEL